MQFNAFIISALSLASFVAASPFASETLCKGDEVVTSTSYIGAAKNVKLETISCTLNEAAAIEDGALLEARQASNVCGAACRIFCFSDTFEPLTSTYEGTTNCFLPAGGGPDPSDCHVIADALKFESQNTGNIFAVGINANNTVSLSFSSCKTFFLNQAAGELDYCRTDWSAVVDFVAPNCQAAQNAHGGNCVANDGRWFIQVQHV
ncbi:hypothetical protein B0H34DRAFT_274601 [Crassisporium funariophilum]|nr:hypothetical protein B0H34DRAFT_274601 [Crassisporium funariophilum]